MRVAFYTLGCKVNQYESEVMANFFASDGFDIVDHADLADIYIINSCTVTASGDKKTKQQIRRFRKQNPLAVIALTGCFPQAFPEEAQILLDADVIQGSYNRGAILQNVKKALASRVRVIDITPHTAGEQFEPMKISKLTDKNLHHRTRAFIKIEDGCDRYCTYCIIPTARGPIRSKPIAEIVDEVLALVQNGYKEIVLVGINLCSYGKEKGDLRLVDVIEAVCAVDGVKRVRLGSLEPELLLDDDLARMAQLEKFCPQFHLSLQSGCDRTLLRMNRHYSADEYYALVEKIRRNFDNPAITTDIMVGFVAESEEEFLESLRFVERVKLAKAHVFAYSVRSGTKAAAMTPQVLQRDKEQRSRRMIEATNVLQREFLTTQINRKCEVLFETLVDENTYVGYTKNYTKVIATGTTGQNLCGEIKTVTINGAADEHCTATI